MFLFHIPQDIPPPRWGKLGQLNRKILLWGLLAVGLAKSHAISMEYKFLQLNARRCTVVGGGRGGREGVGGRGREGVGGNLLFLLLQYIARKNAPIRNRKCSNGAKQKITLPDNFFNFGTAGGQSKSYNNSAPANQKYFFNFYILFLALYCRSVFLRII